uniref:uncharacterized protein LOC120343839 n=1 Tax=Styela clava TaxID=7725 RepID=UPI00193A4EBF|nr:uncharacterized protein LOC120343839 [Styela clava]
MQLTAGSQLKANDAEALHDLAVKMRNCYVTLSHWKKEHMLDAQSYLRDIFDRLSYHLQMDYLRDESRKNGPIPSYMHLLEYVEKIAHLSNTFYGLLMTEHYVKSRQPVNTRPRSAKTYTTTSSTIATTREKKSDNKSTKNTQIRCLCCGDSHFLYHCTKFKDKDTKQSRDSVREYKACFNCLHAGHSVKDCRSTYTCQVNNCRKKHHSLLHDDTLSSQKLVNSNAKSSDSNVLQSFLSLTRKH